MIRIAGLIDRVLSHPDDDTVASGAAGSRGPRGRVSALRPAGGSGRVSELQFAEDVFGRILQRESRYHEKGYLFVLAAIEYLQGQLAGPAACHRPGTLLGLPRPRHPPVRPAGALRAGALEHRVRPATSGRIVFTLVEVGLLATQPGDRIEDFDGVYQFADAFSPTEVWDRVSGV